jgi:hypothetical protein
VDRLEEIDLTKPPKKKNLVKKKTEEAEKPSVQAVEPSAEVMEDSEPDWSVLPPSFEEYEAAAIDPQNTPVQPAKGNTGGWPGMSSAGNGQAPKPPAEIKETSTALNGLDSQSTPSAVAIDPDAIPQKLTVVLTPTGNKDRDKAKLVRAHTILTAHPGNDRFDFLLFENNQQYQLDFPNHTTHVCDEVLVTLKLLVGEDNITIQDISQQEGGSHA